MEGIEISILSRKDARRQTKRDAIVQIAARYFLEHGYAGTTMSGIAAAVGGSKGTLWAHFPAKEPLFVAVLDRLTEDFHAQLALILQSEQDVQATLRHFCHEFVRLVTSSEGLPLFRLVVSEAHRFPEVGQIFNERCPSATQERLAVFLAKAMHAKRLRTGDPDVAARQLMGLCLSGTRQRMLMGLIETAQPTEIARDCDEAMDLFMRGYGLN